MKILIKLTASILSAGLAISSIPIFSSADNNKIYITNTEELIDALENAKAGDELILAEGTYQNDKWLGEWAAFYSYGEGTHENPIILRSENPENPAMLCGTTQENKNVLYITGDNWIIKDIRVSNGQKGIMLDNSNYSIISGCEVFDTGSEAIHLRDNSSYCIVENCYVHDAGTINAKYGEGVYIGSSYKTTDYGYDCHYNTVRNCKFGPNIAADHIDIKEYTIGTLVENCTFDGTGIKGENGGNSFIEIKGNNAIIRNNIGYRNGCEKLLYAFDASVLVDGWGQNNKIYDNTVYLDTADCYIFKEWNCTTEVFRNKAEPESCTYSGNKTIQVLNYELCGDADENGLLDNTDINVLSDYLIQKNITHISADNADINNDVSVDVFDLCELKKKISAGTDDKPKISVDFTKEEAGKWRICNGLSNKAITFILSADNGTELNLGWGYWDPDYIKDDGTKGKWIQISLGTFETDNSGEVHINVETPENNITRIALEVWDYTKDGTNLDQDEIVLQKVLIE